MKKILPLLLCLTLGVPVFAQEETSPGEMDQLLNEAAPADPAAEPATEAPLPPPPPPGGGEAPAVLGDEAPKPEKKKAVKKEKKKKAPKKEKKAKKAKGKGKKKGHKKG